MSARPDRITPSFIDKPELKTARVATVALLTPVDKPYSYIVPQERADQVTAGVRVVVPFGRNQRMVRGICLSVSDAPWDATLKPILDVIDERALLDAHLLELGRWIAQYYAAPLGRTLDLMVPAPVKERAGWKKSRYVRLVWDGDALPDKLTTKQAAVVNALRAAAEPLTLDQCCAAAGCGQSVIQTLAARDIVAIEEVREPVAPTVPEAERHEPHFELSPEQRAAINQLGTAVAARQFSVQVLYGVTGSGKTECYVRTIRQALAEGRQAIMLVPEIALTTQTVHRLRSRFERVALIHSGLTGVQRSRTWTAIAAGEIPVVIGTRSAVFAPCPDLGAIIVDEEHEASYKAQAAPRYHTRDAAIKRAQLADIPIVLGSATPSLETWRNVRQRKHYHLIRLPKRVRGLAMPKMHLVDMHEEHRERHGVHLLSRTMERQLRETLERGEQAVLLLNRRGYASFLHCARCRNAICCPHCSVHMVLHRETNLAHCHYCQTRVPLPQTCPILGCGGKLVRFGIGVQRVEEELRDKFPSARVRRIDSDVMQKAADYVEVLSAFEAREFDVLVGTQMVAKGLDFPFVSFVGVVSADTALALDDFRSEERTFQLVLQVAGRSGRGDQPGHVVVQTFAIDTDPIRHAVIGDYEGFADAELEKRRNLKLPPFTRLLRIVLADTDVLRLRDEAERMVSRIRTLLERQGIRPRIFGPHPAPIERIRDKHRQDLLLFFNTAGDLITAVELLKSEGTLRSKAKTVTLDVDPVSLQ